MSEWPIWRRIVARLALSASSRYLAICLALFS